MILNHAEAQALIICSFRYALGRRSYIVSEICDIIKKNMDNLEHETKKLMYTEIQDALSLGHAGDQVDSVDWEMLKDVLHESLF